MSNENKIVLEILQIAKDLEYGKSISVEEIMQQIDYPKDEGIKLIGAALRSFLLAGDKYYGIDTKIEDHTRVLGLDREGYVAYDVLTNPEIITGILNNKNINLEKVSIFTAIALLRRYI